MSTDQLSGRISPVAVGISYLMNYPHFGMLFAVHSYICDKLSTSITFVL